MIPSIITSHLLQAVVVIFLASLAGCEIEDPNPSYPFPDINGGSDLSSGWPDLRRAGDYPLFHLDGGAGPGDGSIIDAMVLGDGLSSCAPAVETCQPACPPQELCTLAAQGTCASTLAVIGPASEKAVLKAMAQGLATCWTKNPSDDTVCFTFHTCALTTSLDKDTLVNWVCDSAQISDFPSAELYQAAQTVCGCGWSIQRLDWLITTLDPGQLGSICMSYDVEPFYSINHVNIDSCQNFPYP